MIKLTGPTLSTAKQLVIWLLPILPVLYLLGLLARHAVNVPYADEFTLAPLFLKAHDHTLTVADLFAQHNEHRYFFSGLLLIGLTQMAHGDVRADMYFSVVLTVLVSINLWFLIKNTISGSTRLRVLVLFLINLLLFSPVQAENWTWGFQVPLFLCNFLFSCGLLVAFSSLGVAKKFALCLVLAFVATFSFGGGVLLWALTFPVALIRSGMSWKSRIAWGLGWGAAAVGAMALYFFHYVKPAIHPSIAASRNPVDYFLYVTTFLGAHLSRASRLEPIFQAALIGSVLLVLWSGATIHMFRYWRDLDLRQRMLPWVAVGSYAILNALLAAAARIGFGVNQALDSRYTSFSLYLSVAAIGLFVTLRRELCSRIESHRFIGAVLRLETILLTAFALFSLGAFSWGRSSVIEIQQTRLWGKGALLFSNVMDSGEIHDRYLVAYAPQARAYANTLDRIGLLHPSMISTPEISKLHAKHEKDIGFLDYITTSGGSCTVVGWAALPKTRTRAHCIVLSYEDPVRGPVAFRVADEIQSRPDVAIVLRAPAAEDSGWTCHFDRSAIPPGDHLLTAWAFDANRAILYQLDTPKILH